MTGHPTGQSPHAQAPTHRPVWLLVLGGLMVVVGADALRGGVRMLRDPEQALRVHFYDTVRSDAELDQRRQLAAGRAAAVAAHRTTVRIAAASEVLLALFTLAAAAAVLSRDRRGRALALGVALLGIGYQLATLPLKIELSRDKLASGVSPLAEKAEDGGAASASGKEASRRMPPAIVLPIRSAAVEILGSLVLLAYFGGRRGRVLYGIEAPRAEAHRPKTPGS
jgi:hypothetical protein